MSYFGYVSSQPYAMIGSGVNPAPHPTRDPSSRLVQVRNHLGGPCTSASSGTLPIHNADADADADANAESAMTMTMLSRLTSPLPGSVSALIRSRPSCRHWALGAAAALLLVRSPAAASAPVLATASCFTTTAPHYKVKYPPRPKPPPEEEITEAYLKGSGPGGQKIVRFVSLVLASPYTIRFCPHSR